MPATRKKIGWANWSGNESAPSARVLQPQNEDELRQALLTAVQPIRVVGSGHSFTPIVSTSGTIINLDQMGGVVSTNPAANAATLRAGGRLKDLSVELDSINLAFRNLGDINVQSFAGAAATATHGTGQSLGCLASEITAVRLMLANGNIVEGTLEDNPDLVKAAQVSLGALGVMLEATVRVCPAFNLHRRTWAEPIDAILDAALVRWNTHRNFEFFYIPFSGYGINIAHDQTDASATERPPSEDEAGLAMIRSVRNKFKWSTLLRRKLLATGLKRMTAENVVGPSAKLLASTRSTRFNEMEYHLPVESGLDVFREVVSYIEAKRRDVFFPIEVRKTAADEGWLSPFQNAPRISIAVHTAAEDSYDWLFDGIEPIFKAAGGRPHWGKLHSLGHNDFLALYPDFQKFIGLRKQLDPDGVFMTPAIARYWEEGQ